MKVAYVLEVLEFKAKIVIEQCTVEKKKVDVSSNETASDFQCIVVKRKSTEYWLISIPVSRLNCFASKLYVFLTEKNEK